MPENLKNAYSSEKFVRKYINSQPRDPRHLYLDKPAMHKATPNLKGKTALAIGCGDGGELNYLKKKGAYKVVGIDSSKHMVAAARLNAPWAEIHEMSADRLNFKPESFDFVYSDLAVHYVKDIRKVFSGVYKILKEGGTFLFSTTHPIEDTLATVTAGRNELRVLGYSKINGKLDKVYGNYLDFRKIKNKWWGEDEVIFYYTPLSDIINEAIHIGFSIKQVLEPKPVSAMRRYYPDFYRRMTKLPFILILSLKK